MQVSREVDYGVRAIVVLAAHEGEVLSKRRIADEFGIPINFLAIILPKLVHEGLVESLPGPKGGYKLMPKSSDISIFDVICAIDKCFALNRCLDVGKGCEYIEGCPIRPHWKRIQGDIEEYLRHIKFDKLAEDFKIGK